MKHVRHINATDLKAHLGEYIELTAEGPVVVTRRGEPAAVLVSAAEYEQLCGLYELFESAWQAETAGVSLTPDRVLELLLRGRIRHD
jgi:prevent-host-death family protein